MNRETNSTDSLPVRNLLRQERIRCNLRQQDVADKLGTTVVTVNRWERGVQQPSAYYRLQLCDLFKKNAEELGLLPESSTPPITPPAKEPTPIETPTPELPPATEISSSPFPQASFSTHARIRMLRRLHRAYSGLLEHSLREAIRLKLALTWQPDAVQNTTNLLLSVGTYNTRPLPPGASLLAAYDEAENELLILGAPGSGKSTLLQELALQLTARAQQEPSHPFPIIFPLSSWAEDRPPLAEWLITQLRLIYDLSSTFARSLLETQQILPLLDGLDEMEASARPACIAAINMYQSNALMPLVVCSRYEEYEDAAGKERLHLQGALLVQPLSQDQVGEYLRMIGPAVEALHTAIRQNPDVQALATTPLMLNILVLAYQGRELQEILPAGVAPPTLPRQVFAAYVERMLTYRAQSKRSTPEQTLHWLTYLARQMREHDLTIFYLEHLQPNWLTAGSERRYLWLGVRLPGILIGVLASLSVFIFMNTIIPTITDSQTSLLLSFVVIGGFLGALFNWNPFASFSRFRAVHANQAQRHQMIKRVITSLTIGPLLAITLGLILRGPQELSYAQLLHDGGLAGGIIDLGYILPQFLFPYTTRLSLSLSRQGESRSLLLLKQIIHGYRVLPLAVGMGLGVGLCFGLFAESSTLILNGLTCGLSAGLISVLVRYLLDGQSEGVHLAERLRWTRRSLLRGLFTTGHRRATLILISIVTVCVGLAVGLLLYNNASDNNTLSNVLSLGLSSGLSVGLSSGLLYWLFLGLFQGISSDYVEEHQRQVPGKGIRDSLRNGILMCGIASVIICVLSTLSYFLSLVLSATIDSAINVGLGPDFTGSVHESLMPASYSVLQWWQSKTVFALGLCGGLVVGLMSGGLAIWRHTVLRSLLQRAQVFPPNRAYFFDEAVSSILLQKVGGGYRFIHRLLLDYFADL